MNHREYYLHKITRQKVLVIDHFQKSAGIIFYSLNGMIKDINYNFCVKTILPIIQNSNNYVQYDHYPTEYIIRSSN